MSRTKRLIEAAEDEAAREVIEQATSAELVAAIREVAPNAHFGPGLLKRVREEAAAEAGESSELDAAMTDFEELEIAQQAMLAGPTGIQDQNTMALLYNHEDGAHDWELRHPNPVKATADELERRGALALGIPVVDGVPVEEVG